MLIAYQVVQGEAEIQYSWSMVYMPEFKRMTTRQAVVYASVVATAGVSLIAKYNLASIQLLQARIRTATMFATIGIY